MNIKNIVISVLATTLISTTTLAETLNLNSLDKNQLTELIKGNTLTTGPGGYVNSNKYVANTLIIYYAADGKIKGRWLNPIKGDPQRDEGTWTIKEDGAQCNDWKHWGHFCVYFYQIKDHYLIASTDQNEIVIIAKDKITKGDGYK
jgi:hypothetical protein